jgi:Dehydrogenases with different specificities (related to short-chain alcohol dehydrogenases)
MADQGARRLLLCCVEQKGELTMARQYLGLGRPSDVANLTAFLLSEASRFITSSTIGVDGGKLSW